MQASLSLYTGEAEAAHDISTHYFQCGHTSTDRSKHSFQPRSLSASGKYLWLPQAGVPSGVYFPFQSVSQGNFLLAHPLIAFEGKRITETMEV